jgi:hypothetical protein
VNAKCGDRERIFMDGTAEEWTALDVHAATCAECAEEVRSWKALSTAAAELRDYSEDPVLWGRIESALIQQQAETEQRKSWRDVFAGWRWSPAVWQTVLAGAMVVALAVGGGYVYKQRDAKVEKNGTDQLLKSAALGEVERTERAYADAIGKLEAETKPQLENADSPLMASYREKLMVLDSAIDELQAQAGNNPSNAHLRHQLLAMYQEKQETLQEVLETKRQ